MQNTTGKNLCWIFQVPNLPSICHQNIEKFENTPHSITILVLH